MTKTLIEIDDEYLAAAHRRLAPPPSKHGQRCPPEVAALAARRRDLQRLTSGGLPDLEYQDVMKAAWQR